MKKEIRILALVTDAFGGDGGISQYNRDLLTAVSSLDVVKEVIVLPRLGLPDQPVPTKIKNLPATFNRLFYTFKSLKLILSEGPFDVIFCGHLAHASLAAVLSKLTKTPIWLQLHGIEAWTCPSRLYRWGVEQSDLVTVVSRYTKFRFSNWVNLSPEKIRVLSNTVSEIYMPGEKSETLIKKYDLHDKKVLLTVSRISKADRYKGHDRVISALAKIKNNIPNIIYLIAGLGDSMDDLKALAKSKGVEQIVKFVGRVDNEELPDLYRTVDVFVMPSTNEGFGIVFLEAMRSGITTVSGNVDGSVDPLQDGDAGYTVSGTNEDVLVETIKAALNSPIDGTPYAQKFSIRAFSEHANRLLIQLINQPSSNQ